MIGENLRVLDAVQLIRPRQSINNIPRDYSSRAVFEQDVCFSSARQVTTSLEVFDRIMAFLCAILIY
jgi:hypothetical protein